VGFNFKTGSGYVREPYASSNLYFGVELEVAACDSDAVHAVVNGAHDFMVEYDDPSIRSCEWQLELQSHACTWTWWQQNRKRMNQLIRGLRNNDCYSDSAGYGCGLHVHFTNVLTDEHSLSIMQMIYAHPKQCAVFSHRKVGALQNWASLELLPTYSGSCACESCVAARAKRAECCAGSVTREAVRDIIFETDEKWEKMRAVHFSTEYPTIEIRLFSGTLNCRQLWANLEFCRALIEYTGQPDFNHETMCQWDMFKYWVHKLPHFNCLKWALNQVVVEK
jgi:hypothetical protein